MKEIFPRWVGLCALSVLMILIMFNADFLYHKAFALSLTQVNNTLNTTGIVRVGSQIWVSSDDSATVKVWDAVTLTLLGSISADVIYLFTVNSKVYGYAATATSVFEFDPSNIAGGIIRTSGTLTGCLTTTSPTFDPSGAGRFFCGNVSGNTIKILDLSTFVITTSSTINTGAHACQTPAALAYDSIADALFVHCNFVGSEKIVVIEDIASSGTPDYSVSTGDSAGSLVWVSTHQELVMNGNTGDELSFYDVDTTANTIVADETISHQSGTVEDKGLFYDINSDRIYVYGSTENLDVFNAENHDRIITILVGTCGGGSFECTVFAYSALLVYVSQGNADFYIVNMDGVGVGGGSEEPPTASVCYVDRNFDGIADFIFNDVGGPNGFPTVGNPDAGVPDGMCDWSGFGTTSPPPITDAGGGLACLTGIIPCTNGQPTDPNPQTNGLGYLLVIFLLAVMILLFGVAQMKLGLGIPDWLWMIGTFAVIGFATLVGWIDSTLFIIGAVIIAALGAVSFIKKFAGGF